VHPVRKARQEMGVSVQDLAEDAGISPAYVYLIEENRRRGSVDVLTRIAVALGLSLDEVVGRGGRERGPLVGSPN
jgi:transcriptional regulator with XRE-family HTH domain